MCRVSAIPELVGIVVDLAVVGTPAGNSRDQPFKDRKFMVQIVNFKLKRGGGVWQLRTSGGRGIRAQSEPRNCRPTVEFLSFSVGC